MNERLVQPKQDMVMLPSGELGEREAGDTAGTMLVGMMLLVFEAKNTFLILVIGLLS